MKKMLGMAATVIALPMMVVALGDEWGKPERLLQSQPHRPEPVQHTPLTLNPPTFRWPGADRAKSCQIQISRSREMQNADSILATNKFYRPIDPLRTGQWWWRYRMGDNPDSVWSDPVSFVVSADLPRWPIPGWKELMTRIPPGHPRLLIQREELDHFRQLANGPWKHELQAWSRKMESKLGESWSVDTYKSRVPSGPASTDAEKQRIVVNRRWAAKAAGIDLMAPVNDLCWLWLATGNDELADEIHRRVMLAVSLDPEGFVSHRNADFGNTAIVAYTALAYDFLYDSFSPDERSSIRSMLVARTKPIMQELESAPLDVMRAHGWQRVYADGLSAALALYGEEPVAAEWVERGLKSFVALYPWYGGIDGGSQECANYYNATNMMSSLRIRDLFYHGFGLDFASGHPWFAANPYYLMYAFPPGGIISRIGDVGIQRQRKFPTDHEKLAALRMAQLHGNGHAADYAARIQANPIISPEYLRWGTLDETQAVSLDRLPAARLFRDIGTVFMHSHYTQAEENVRLEFRSSPYGGIGHSHADQNSFHIIAFNEPLLLDSGYYTPYGDPHHRGWSTQTKAHNTLLVDGTGQPWGDTRGYGQIRYFEQNDDWVYAKGSAATAYRDVSLKRFDRHVVWLRGSEVQTYVIFDSLESGDGQKHRFDWLLHAAQRIDIQESERRLLVRGQKAEATVKFVEPARLDFSQTNRFEPPAVNWRPNSKDMELKNQWHLRATPPPARDERFIVVIRVGRPGTTEFSWRDLMDGVIVDDWKVRLLGNRVWVEREH